MAINAGYMGAAQIGGKVVRFSDASIAAKQEVVIPDLVMADYDHDSWYYGPITIDGSISGPIDEMFGSGVWEWAVTRDTCGLLTAQPMVLSYYCAQGDNNGIDIPQVLANNLTVSATAGDVANFSIDVIGSGSNGNSPTFGPQDIKEDETRRLVTWDAMSLTITGNDGITFTNEIVSAFEFSIANNVTPAYSLGQGDLWPAELIAGIRTITGSVTLYNIPVDGFDALEAFASYSTNSVGTVSFTIPGTPGINVNAKVRWHRVVPTANPGPVTATMAFSGVGHQSF